MAKKNVKLVSESNLILVIDKVTKNKKKTGKPQSFHHHFIGVGTSKKPPLGEIKIPGKSYWMHLDVKNPVSKKITLNIESDFKVTIKQYDHVDEDTSEENVRFCRELKLRLDGDTSPNESLAEARQAYKDLLDELAELE